MRSLAQVATADGAWRYPRFALTTDGAWRLTALGAWRIAATVRPRTFRLPLADLLHNPLSASHSLVGFRLPTASPSTRAGF